MLASIIHRKVEKNQRVLYTGLMSKEERICVLFEKSRAVLNALGDSVRQDLLLGMMGTEALSVQQLADRTSLSRPTISHHLRVLREAGIIVEYKKGRQIFYRIQRGEYFDTVKELILTLDTVIEEGEK